MDFHYKDIIPNFHYKGTWDRSFDEYLDMFNLSEDDLARDIVDVGGGTTSFNARMHQRGTPVVSVDPIYRFSEVELRQRIVAFKRQTMEEFSQDFETGRQQGRYVVAALPNLPFPDRHFDLVLSAHLLFFYSANRDLAFHLDAARELLRIGNEVRVFPIVDVNSNSPLFLLPVVRELKKDGIDCSVESVPYHLQKTGNEMLRLTRSALTPLPLLGRFETSPAACISNDS